MSQPSPLQLPNLQGLDVAKAEQRAKAVADRFVQTDAELERVRSLREETLFRVFQV